MQNKLLRKCTGLLIGTSILLPIGQAFAQSAEDFGSPKRPRGEKTGFFDDSMKSGGLVQGMDLGLPKRNSGGLGEGVQNPSVGAVFGGMDSVDGINSKKPRSSSLVPDVETSNSYTVPTPKPTPKPTPVPTSTPTPEPQVSVGERNEPPTAEYLQQLMEQTRNPGKIGRPKPPPAASEQIPTPKPQSYTF